MGKLGISIYPDKCKFEDDKKYLDLAKKYGFTRIFTSLLQIKGDAESVVSQFREIIVYANSIGMEVMLDVNTKLAPILGIDFSDLAFFHELGAKGVRLDFGFDGAKEAEMTKNPYDLKIEINMSGIDSHVETIMYRCPKKENLYGSFNFYPQRYTGLEINHFMESARIFNGHGLNTAAFVNAPSGDIGPWPMQEGICTLELHRDLSIGAQVRHLKMTEAVDDILIGNAYASEAELKEMSEAFFENDPTLRVELIEGISENERASILTLKHLYRGDYSGYMIRSAWSRFLVRDKKFPENNAVPIKRGDVLILNENYGQYQGEVQIALKEMENPGRVNVVGHIAKEDMILLDGIKLASDFNLVQA